MRRLSTLFDIRPGERWPVLLGLLYIATVTASFLLAKPIRNALFLERYGAYNLVYVYAGVPLVLSVFAPLYSRLAARLGQRRVVAASLAFFALNVVAFWYAFRFARFPGLAGLFYVWVNAYGVIASVQAWSLIGTLFDTRQAKRLFGLIGSGASLGAIVGGLMASTLVTVVGGAANLLLLLAALIALASLIVVVIRRRTPSPRSRRGRDRARASFRDTLIHIRDSRYLRLMAMLVFFVAIVTQWTGFQFSLVADARFGGDADRLTEFFGRFNLAFGVVALLMQLFVTGPVLRRAGIIVSILLLPAAIGFGSVLVVLLPGFWTVFAANAFDQTLRFSVDKASYELLYLPLAPSVRARVRTAIDVIVNRGADAVGAILLGVATQGFLGSGGLGLDLRGLAALTLVLAGAWLWVASRLRGEYVEAIRESIESHRLDTERETGSTLLDRSAAEALSARLGAGDLREILYALDLLAQDPDGPSHPALRALLRHPSAEVRRRTLGVLAAGGDPSLGPEIEPMLADQDLEIRTEALLFLSRHVGVDPLERVRELGDFQDFSIRAGMAAFLARPGPTRNLDAARAILRAMIEEPGVEGVRTRLEAARLLAHVPEGLDDELALLLADEQSEVARQAMQAVVTGRRLAHADAVIARLADPDLASAAADALASLGDDVVLGLRRQLLDRDGPLAVRREVPGILARIASADAEQVLMESLLQDDTTLRHRVIRALNHLRLAHPEMRFDAQALEMLLGAELTGHYRSYQLLGALATLDERNPVVVGLRQSMDREIERIFRLLGLLMSQGDIYSAYVGLRASDPRIRANALEFLDQVLKPQLRGLLLPLVDPHVSEVERIRLADRLVGAPVHTVQQALTTLLDSEDSWLKSCAAYAVGAMGLDELQAELDRWAEHPDPLVRETVRTARRRLAGREAEAAGAEPPAGERWETTRAMGVG